MSLKSKSQYVGIVRNGNIVEILAVFIQKVSFPYTALKYYTRKGHRVREWRDNDFPTGKPIGMYIPSTNMRIINILQISVMADGSEYFATIEGKSSKVTAHYAYLKVIWETHSSDMFHWVKWSIEWFELFKKC